MNKSRLFQLIAVVAMVMMVAFTGVSVQSVSAAEAEVPFSASISGTVSLIDPVTFALNGSGQSIHLGNVKSYHADGSFTGPTTDVLIETLTAANGDTLVILCSQVLEEVGSRVYRGTDTWTVIGGTGRFSGASGSGTGETSVNLNQGTFVKEMTGTIAY